jgi:hypothetical protein
MKKISSELRIAPSISFFKLKEEIAEGIVEEFSNWETDSLGFNLVSPENKESAILQHNRIAFVGENVQSEHKYLELLKKILKTYNDKLSVKAVFRLGIRFTVIQKTNLKFPELAEIMQKRFYSADKEIGKILVEKYSDVAFSVDFEKDGYKFHYLIGPVSKNEAKGRFNSAFGVNDSDTSETMIFLDVDCYTEEKSTFDKIEAKIEAMQSLASKIVTDSLALFEVK